MEERLFPWFPMYHGEPFALVAVANGIRIAVADIREALIK